MENEFRVGDRVERIENAYNGMGVGDVGAIIDMGVGGIALKEWGGGHDHSNLKLITGKQPKPKKPTHIVTYDVKGCGDPHKLAYSEKEAKETSKELLKDNNVVEDSIVIYEIKKIIRPKINISFRGG